MKNGDAPHDLTKGEESPVDEPAESKKRIDLALLISLIALAVSGAQLFFTSPLIYGQVFSPRLIVENLNRDQNGSAQVGFVLGNVGRSTAEDIHLGILAMEGDSFSLLPEYSGRIEANDSVHLVTYTVMIDQLHPGEEMVILLHPGDLHEGAELPRWQNMGGMKFSMPSITFLRSKSGVGEVNATSFKPQISIDKG